MGERIKILVVEDEVSLVSVIERKLKKVGFEVVSCTTATQAISELSKAEKLPDIIWLDYYLPDMSGLEFMKKVKENSEWANIPVIVISNSASLEKTEAMMSLGVKKYLLKAEYRLEDIIKIIRQLFTAHKMKKNE